MEAVNSILVVHGANVGKQRQTSRLHNTLGRWVLKVFTAALTTQGKVNVYLQTLVVEVRLLYAHLNKTSGVKAHHDQCAKPSPFLKLTVLL